jgi:hypothetical protein
MLRKFPVFLPIHVQLSPPFQLSVSGPYQTSSHATYDDVGVHSGTEPTTYVDVVDIDVLDSFIVIDEHEIE